MAGSGVLHMLLETHHPRSICGFSIDPGWSSTPPDIARVCQVVVSDRPLLAQLCSGGVDITGFLP